MHQPPKENDAGGQAVRHATSTGALLGDGVSTAHQGAHAAAPPHLLKAAEAAKFFGISEVKFHQLRAKGLMPHPVTLGGRCLRWVRSELEEALANLPRAERRPEPDNLRLARQRRLAAQSSRV